MRYSFAPFDRECEEFLTRKLGINFFATDWSQSQWLCTSARDDEGRLMGVCVFEFKTPFDAHFSCAIADRRCLTRRLLRALFTAVFSRARRVTALIEPWNAGAIRQARLMGFQPEGYMRMAVEGTRDALVFGMLREECRYLRRVPRETSRKVTPGAVITNVGHDAAGNPKQGGNVGMRSDSGANGKDLPVSQLGQSMTGTGILRDDLAAGELIPATPDSALLQPLKQGGIG
jgi:RimJ/RimL family protein N-acetyltransferase